MNVLDASDRTMLADSIRDLASTLGGKDHTAVMSALSEHGFVGALTSEDFGGMDVDPASAATMVATLGAFHIAENLAEAMLAARASAALDGPLAGALVAGEKCAAFSRLPGLASVADLVSGRLEHVMFAQSADVLLARIDDGKGLALIDLSANGVTVEPSRGLDLERPCYTVRCEDVAPIATSVDAADIARLDRLTDLLTAAWLQATTAHCLDSAAEHLSTRSQFGRPLIALPVLRDTLAHLRLRLENLDLLVTDAAIRPEPEAAATALSYARAHCPAVAEKAIHLFGGMGFTWEVPMHFYLRRLRQVVDFGLAPAPQSPLAALIGEAAA